MITIQDLFKDFPYAFWGNLPNLTINGIVADNRQVSTGFVFVAIEGYTVDSHAFIPDAIQRGATAVIGSQDLTGVGVPYIRVENSRQTLAHLAAAYYGFPARRLIMVGVTGTDGKTTTSNLIHQILLEAGIKAGLISTVNAVIGDEIEDTGFHVTTPDALVIQRYLAKMIEAGLTHCVLETTSHGWAQHRVDACEFNLGVLTNITHEHMDEHGTFENYRAAKMRLFESLAQTGEKSGKAPLRIAIINRDDGSYSYVNRSIGSLPEVKFLTYSVERAGDVEARQIHLGDDRSHYLVRTGELQFSIESHLPGLYNVSNCLAAIATTVVGLGLDVVHAQRAIKEFMGIPGRMEYIRLGQEFTAIVDFAHTPNALIKTLEAARALNPRRLIVVFGSAGLRDKEKRRLMSEAAAVLADISIVTAEDPRTEPIESILETMVSAAVRKGAVLGESLFAIPDRRTAIRKAVNIAEKEDFVLICGKGHEQSMCFGTQEFPWDDRIALKAAISERLGIQGPEMPWLPTG